MNLQETARNVDATMGAIEAIIVSIVGRLASWIAGVPSAVLVAKSVGRIFDLTQGWAWAIAVSFELIGLTTTSLWAGFREWNQNIAKRKTDPKAPEKLALAFVIAYLVVDLVMIIILTVTDFLVNRNAEVFVGVTYPVMTAVSVLVMNERIKHRKRQADFAQQKEKEAQEKEAARAKREAKKAAEATAQQAAETEQQAVEVQAQTLRSLENELSTLWVCLDNPDATQVQVAEIAGVSRRTVSNHLARLDKAGIAHRNGNGIEVQVDLEMIEFARPRTAAAQPAPAPQQQGAGTGTEEE